MGTLALILAALAVGYIAGRRRRARDEASDRVWHELTGYVHGCLGHRPKLRSLR